MHVYSEKKSNHAALNRVFIKLHGDVWHILLPIKLLMYHTNKCVYNVNDYIIYITSI